MEYDIFISCKSEDYSIAEGVYDYLKQEGFKVFLSSRELRRLGESEYMDAISEALGAASHLILVSSSKEYPKSKWVKFEWSTFLNEMLSGRKHGKIVTILSNMTVAELPIQLRSYESFTLDNYKKNILQYVETPASQERRREAQKAEEEKAKKRKTEILQEIKIKEAEYKSLKVKLDVLKEQIDNLRNEAQLLEFHDTRAMALSEADHISSSFVDIINRTLKEYHIELRSAGRNRMDVISYIMKIEKMQFAPAKRTIDKVPVVLPTSYFDRATAIRHVNQLKSLGAAAEVVVK